MKSYFIKVRSPLTPHLTVSINIAQIMVYAKVTGVENTNSRIILVRDYLDARDTVEQIAELIRLAQADA